MLGNWAVPAKSDPATTPAAWLEAIGLPGIVIHHSTADPEDYAVRWNEFLRANDVATFDAAVERWIAAYADGGIQGIASGGIVVHRDRTMPGFVSRQVMTQVP